jgi:hypothetical protein
VSTVDWRVTDLLKIFIYIQERLLQRFLQQLHILATLRLCNVLLECARLLYEPAAKQQSVITAAVVTAAVLAVSMQLQNSSSASYPRTLAVLFTPSTCNVPNS